MQVTSSTAEALTPTKIALGNFDGIHLGHQRVLQPILAPSAWERPQKTDRPYATVVTFSPHPREFFTGQSWQLLTPLSEKKEQLAKLGIEQLILLPFDRELAALSPQQFVEKILVEQLQAKSISVGEDFRFGHQRVGTAEDLREIAAKFGVQVTISSLKTCGNPDSTWEGMRISSSSIRQALEQGDVGRVKKMLGRAYILRGTVVTGEQLGRKIGFPTANLALPAEKLLPRPGVYSVGVSLAGNRQDQPFPLRGVMNVGCRPTVDGKVPTVEVHLLDWSGNLYDQILTVSLESFLRPEQKFPSLEALKTQIAADCDTARKCKT